MHWQITIDGDDTDLTILSETFGDEILSVMEQDGVYVMTSSELDELTKGRAVLDRAKNFVPYSPVRCGYFMVRTAHSRSLGLRVERKASS